ncbi:polysaccharide deacetylase family protein, partial [Nitrosopumilus sp.]
MKSGKFTIIAIIIFSITLMISIENAYADKTIEVEIKYTNDDRVDHNEIKLLVYQDFNNKPMLEKTLESNPDFITVPENHRYKIEVFVNGMYGDVGYVQLNNNPEKLIINIPLSGGVQFGVFYKNGQVPIKDATVIIKSHDNSEWRRGTTNDQGETIRYWVQSTSKQGDHYIADVYLGELFLKSYSPIKLLPGIATDQKIVTAIPEYVENLISINLYDGSKLITSTDGEYNVILKNIRENNEITSKINFRGDAQFSNLKSGTYTVMIKTNNENENRLWPQNNIHVIGDLNKFNIFKFTEEILDEENPFRNCNCISFRLDDVQDYWLSETQIELINLFTEKNIPLSIGIIGNLIGSDQKIVSVIKDSLDKNEIEIVNHSWNNEALTNLSKDIQEKYVVDTNKKILEIFGVESTSLIPPQNLYNEDTVEILKKNGFSHLISHIITNNQTYFDDGFYIVPATTETGVLINGIDWVLNEKEQITEEIIQSLNKRGYAIVMLHPQEFTIKNNDTYGDPNQSALSELSELLDEISQLDSSLVKISNVKNFPPVIENKTTVDNKTDTQIDTVTNEKTIDTCKCVSFRLDGVQDYWLNEVQMEIMNTFIENRKPLTVGIIADAFGEDQKITNFMKENIVKNGKYLEVATKGIGLTPYSNYNKSEQNENLKNSIEFIKTTLNVTPHIFLPPNNVINSDTMMILKENGITHLSSSLINEYAPPFELKGKEIYRFPQITSTGKFNTVENIYEGRSTQQIVDEAVQGVNNYGFAVISIQPQEFSTIVNSTYTNSPNQKQIENLVTIISILEGKGFKIVPIGKIDSNIIVLVPEWIKSNAGWWADGSIDDKTFVQGIEYLVKNGI